MATQAEIEATLKLKDELTAQVREAEKSVGSLNKTMGATQGVVGEAQKGFKDLVTQATGLSPAMLGVAGAITAVGVGVVSAVKSTIELGDKLVELNAKTGISIEGLQALKFA